MLGCRVPTEKLVHGARTGSLVRQSPSTIGTDRVSRRSRSQEVDPHWGTDSSTRPRPPTQVPTGQVQSSTTAETMAEHQGMQPARQSALPPSARLVSQRGTDHDGARLGDFVHYLCISRQAVAPREGGVLQLRVARKLCNYVSSSQELSSVARHGHHSASATHTATKPSDCFELLRCLSPRTVRQVLVPNASNCLRGAVQ